MRRRSFIRGTASSLITTRFALALDTEEQLSSKVHVGIITDLHFGNLAPDGIERFDVFAKAVRDRGPDHIVQLGDFCHPEPAAKELLEKWHALETDKYHVLGNHDMDKGSKAEMQKFWGMEKRYYHFEQNGWRFIAIDMNNLRKGDEYIPYGNANFYVDSAMRTWADPEQLDWLEATLAESELPTIIYTHQPIGNRPESPQQRPLLDIIKKHRTPSGRPKTRAVICGHQHEDWHRTLDGVHHICVNSASYLWKDGRPWAYKDSLFTFMKVEEGNLTFKGMTTTWKERPKDIQSNPTISSRDIRLG